MDYLKPATLANTVILVMIVHNIFIYNFTWSLATGLGYALTLGSMLTGLATVLRSPHFPGDVSGVNSTLHGDAREGPENQSLLTFGAPDQPHVDVFWSVCVRDVATDAYRLLAEYVLIYLPILVLVLTVIVKNRGDKSGMFLVRSL